MKSSHSKQNGFSLVGLLSAVAIMSIVGLLMAQVMNQNAKTQSRALSLSELSSLKQQMTLSLSNGSAWSSTIAYNTQGSIATVSKMGCLIDGTACKDGAGQPLRNVPFALVDVMGGVLFDATLPNNGLTMKGDKCSTFNAASGNAACPFRYELTWSAACQAADSCLNPQVEINATLLYRPGSASVAGLERSVVNEGLYSINKFYPKSANVEGVCRVKTAVFTVPGVTRFRVPRDFRVLVAEAWGGGGGAAAIPWSCVIGPGTAGGNSSFNNTNVALGGQGGRYSSGNGLYFVWFCDYSNGTCGFLLYDPNFCAPQPPLPRIWQGENGPVSAGTGFPDDENQCGSTLGTYPGYGGTSPSQNGDQTAGSGAGTPLQHYPLLVCGGNICILQAWWAGPGEGGKRGGYTRTQYTPATLTPDTDVDVVVGAGGIGGTSGGLRGGDGGAGMVKISWW